MFVEDHFCDSDGNPAGGISSGRGFTIAWQRGALGRGQQRKEPNGAFVEDVIVAVRKRLLFYQGTQFCCHENSTAIAHLSEALAALKTRTARREAAGTEGTHAEEPGAEQLHLANAPADAGRVERLKEFVTRVEEMRIRQNEAESRMSPSGVERLKRSERLVDKMLGALLADTFARGDA